MITEFYAAFIKSSYYVEGDERSRTNPGHGYAAHNVDYTEVIEFKDFDDMKKWVEDQEKVIYGREKYKIVKCTPMIVRSTVEIKTEIG